MQAARNAIEALKETAANIGASAKSGFEKTKATIQEKSEMMNAQDQKEMDMATQKKQEKINQAEMDKQQAREYNAAKKIAALAGHTMQGYNNATGPVTIDTTGPSTENVAQSNTGHGTGTATYNTSGLPSSTGPGTATCNASGPGHDNVLPSSTRPATTAYSKSGPGSETATYPTSDSGQMGANQTTMMHRHGHGHEGLTEDVVGSHPIETNSGVGVTAQTTLGAGSAPSSGLNFS